MADGINNIQIENFFQKEENENLKNNFVCVFSMDYITRYIKFHELVREKKRENIHLQYLIQTHIINQERIRGVF